LWQLILAATREAQWKEHKMTQEDWDEVEQLEDAHANPKAYGLDQDGWPDPAEFNAAVMEVSGTGFDDE
jgi:hypothetical protein